MTPTVAPDRKTEQVSPPAGQVLSTMVDHWVKSRVDTPVQVVGRLDDAAKQLLVVAGILQGILIAIVKLHPDGSSIELTEYSIPAMVALVGTAFFAMLTLCVQSGYLDTEPLYRAFRQSPGEAGALSVVDLAIKRWCDSHVRVRYWKRLLLGLAMISLVTSMSLSVACVWRAAHPRDGVAARVSSADAR